MSKDPGRRNRVVLFVIILAAALLTIGANVWKTNLRVGKFVVTGNRITETNEILQLVQVRRGTPLYAADLTGIQHNVMSHYYIRSATIRRDLPATITIAVVERIPVAIVNRNDITYLDEEGTILPRALSRTVYDLPVISGIRPGYPLKYGARVDDSDILEALGILAGMKLVSRDLFHRISEVQLRDSGDIVLTTADGSVPIVFGRGGTASKLVRLETFWNTVLRERGLHNLEYLDLRYEDQIIARWSPAERTAS